MADAMLNRACHHSSIRHRLACIPQRPLPPVLLLQRLTQPTRLTATHCHCYSQPHSESSSAEEGRSSRTADEEAEAAEAEAADEEDEDDSVLLADEDEHADESVYSGPPHIPSGSAGAGSMGGMAGLSGAAALRLDTRREWWEDNQIFGPPSLNSSEIFDRPAKHQLLLAIGHRQSIDQSFFIFCRILQPAIATLLTPHNYTFILLTLHSHARPILQQAAYRRTDAPRQSDAVTAGQLSSLVCAYMEASFVCGWQLSTRTYACALHMLASLDDPRCLRLLSSVEACQDVIVSDGCYGPVMAYLARQRDYAAVCQLWRSMQLRYERDRRQWDVPLQHFISSYLLDDEKQAEIAALAVGTACQQLWMYHTAIAAALRTRQVNTAHSIVQQLHSWRQRWTAIRTMADGSMSSLGTLPSSSQPLFDHVNFRAAAVEPVWSALTYHFVLSAHAVAGEWWMVMLALTDMAAAGVLLPLHRSTVIRVAECAIRHGRWSELRSLLSFIEQRDPQLLSLELVGLLTKRLEAVARVHSGDNARLAALESERLVRLCLAHLEQQQVVQAFSAAADGDGTHHSSFEVMSFVVDCAVATPLQAIRRLVSLLLLATDQRRRNGHTPIRLFLRCESAHLLPAITSHVRSLGGSTHILQPDSAASATANSLLAEYALLQQSSKRGCTAPSLDLATAAPDVQPGVMFVSGAARPHGALYDQSFAPRAQPAALSSGLYDSSCSAGSVLSDVLQLRAEASWPLVKRCLKRSKRRLAAAGVLADTAFIEAAVRCWAFRPTRPDEHEQPTRIDTLLQALDGQQRHSQHSTHPTALSPASFPLGSDVYTTDLAAAVQLCRDRNILHSLASSAIQPAASLLSLHERMSVLTVHCAVMTAMLLVQHSHQPLRQCSDAAPLPALFVQSLDSRLLHVAADFLQSVCGVTTDWLQLPAADDCHSAHVGLLTALRTSVVHSASDAPLVLLVSCDSMCGWLLAGARLNDRQWVERCLRSNRDEEEMIEQSISESDGAELKRTQSPAQAYATALSV